ncbi:ketohydroxyglutarate aldolase [filamentous cyanobacterium CCP5]|nr:ketohydroxyglutarate aldolase [filamentous cyanobacterium CCP5]
MEREEWLQLLSQQRILAVIRAPSLQAGVAMAKAVEAGGLRLIEVTWTSVQPAHLVAHLREHLPGCYVGAGTLLTLNALEEAISAGAQFGFSPHTDPELIEQAQHHGCPFVPGALTPTEIVTAWQRGASGVKVFPITAVGGADYVRNLQGPLGHIPLIPTGGVTAMNAADLIRAGATAVGLASSLFPTQAVKTQDWAQITAQTKQLRRQLEPSRPD